MYKIIEINCSNKYLIEEFIRQAGSSLDTFRYFKKRPVEVIQNHLFTAVLCHEKKPVAYGHLDYDNYKVWLGIAVIEGYLGKGIGKQMMQVLIKKAKELKLKEIHLTVGKENEVAIKLYKNFGFVEIEEKDNYLHYILNL